MLLRDDFESELGWNLPGEWEVDQPLGLGSAPGDPATAFNGSGVLGHDLTGLGSHPGDYEPSTVETATSPSIDGSTLTQVELQFERWLNVANGSRAYLELKNSAGGWLALWSSPTIGGPTETGWSHVSHDVSQYAAGNPDFQVRFRQQSYLGTSFHAGWNVDRFILRDGTQPAFESCGGCGGTPTFAGVGSVTDDDPCAVSGVTLSWLDPPAWGTGFGGTFTVYRDTSPGFAPSPANRVATGIAGTTWTDLGAPTDVPLYYLVRAESDESCGSGPNNGGMVDENTVYASVVNQTAQLPPGSVGATLVVDQIDGVHARLGWTSATDAAAYHVHRSPMADGGFEVIAQPTGTLHEDTGALTDHRDWYYLVVAADSCGNETP